MPKYKTISQFLANEPAFLGVRCGIPFYEDPQKGDEAHVFAIVGDMLMRTPWWELPNDDEVAEWYGTSPRTGNGRNRCDDAVEIDQGASNPLAIVRAMGKACDEMMSLHLDNRHIVNDPALRLMCHQLDHVLDGNELRREMERYCDAQKWCRGRAALDRNRQGT